MVHLAYAAVLALHVTLVVLREGFIYLFVEFHLEGGVDFLPVEVVEGGYEEGDDGKRCAHREQNELNQSIGGKVVELLEEVQVLTVRGRLFEGIAEGFNQVVGVVVVSLVHVSIDEDYGGVVDQVVLDVVVVFLQELHHILLLNAPARKELFVLREELVEHFIGTRLKLGDNLFLVEAASSYLLHEGDVFIPVFLHEA